MHTAGRRLQNNGNASNRREAHGTHAQRQVDGWNRPKGTHSISQHRAPAVLVTVRTRPMSPNQAPSSVFLYSEARQLRARADEHDVVWAEPHGGMGGRAPMGREPPWAEPPWAEPFTAARTRRPTSSAGWEYLGSPFYCSTHAPPVFFGRLADAPPGVLSSSCGWLTISRGGQ